LVAVSVGVIALCLTRLTSERTLLRVYRPIALTLLFFAGLNITVGLYYAGLARWSVGTMLYMLAPIFGFYLLTRRMAVLVVAAVGVEYGWALAVSDGPNAPVATWLFVMSILAATAYFIGGLVDHADKLAASERHAREELDEASRQKSAFMAAMSHELRTPMNAIIGFSEVLEDRVFGELNDKQADYIHDVIGSGRHLLSLINDILDLSKIEAGHMELAIHEVDVAALVEHAVSFVRPQIAHGNIGLRVELDPEVGEVQADEQKLLQALVNLLSNAVKFTPDSGAISVGARRADGRVVISVTDSGPGIALADQERIFEEFAQAGPPVDGRQVGTGLGLALARRYTELHEGRLTVDSAVGAGSTFRLEVPAGR
jgi:signal transduction histidine kinase